MLVKTGDLVVVSVNLDAEACWLLIVLLDLQATGGANVTIAERFADQVTCNSRILILHTRTELGAEPTIVCAPSETSSEPHTSQIHPYCKDDPFLLLSASWQW